MPLSGSVTAGSAALASQYNNLRDDVLNVSTGHTHTGASENGAKVHGSAIASTGATNGQVLTANGSGGASFTTLAQSGAVTLISGTATHGTATDGGTPFFYTSGPTGNQYNAITGGGTVILHHQTLSFTTNATIYRRALDSNTIVASTALAPATAGTTIRALSGYGWNAGTAFVMIERGKTGSVVTYTLRKMNVAMTSVMWSTTLVSGSATTGSYDTYGPFSYIQGGVRYASGPGIWYGGDYRGFDYAAGTMQIASVWVVNDVSGSAYSAPWGSAVGTANTYDDAKMWGLVFVPSSTAATNGTIHAWGQVGGTPRYVNYAVGSASITAISTAIGTYGSRGITDQEETGIYPAPMQQVYSPYSAVWLSTPAKIALSTNEGFYIYDRSFSTAEYFSPRGQGNAFSYLANLDNLDCGAFDQTTGYGLKEGAGNSWGRYGNADSLFTPMGTALNVTTAMFGARATLAGNGSATHIFSAVSNTGGTSASYQLAGIAKVPFGTTSTTSRLMTITSPLLERILSIDCGGSALLMSQTPGTSVAYTQTPISFIAGTAQVFVYVRPVLSNQSNLPLRKLSETTQGGTVIVSGFQVALS